MAKAQTRPFVESGAYPTGRAIVLFAIAEPAMAGRRLTVDGCRVKIIRFGQVALVVAYLDRQEYGGEALERKRTEAEALAAEARLQERVIERVSRNATVLPQRCLTVFSDTESLEEAARAAHVRWTRAIARMSAKHEFSVQVFFGPHVRGPNRPYSLRVSELARAGRFVERATGPGGEAVAAHLRELWQACTGLAASVRVVKSVDRRRQLLSAAFLLPDASAQTFRLLLSEWSLRGRDLGLSYYLEGPRSPFSFSP